MVQRPGSGRPGPVCSFVNGDVNSALPEAGWLACEPLHLSGNSYVIIQKEANERCTDDPQDHACAGALGEKETDNGDRSQKQNDQGQ